MFSILFTLKINSADTNDNDNRNIIYLIQPNFFLSDFGILYGSKSNIIPVQQAYPHHPLPNSRGPIIFATK